MRTATTKTGLGIPLYIARLFKQIYYYYYIVIYFISLFVFRFELLFFSFFYIFIKMTYNTLEEMLDRYISSR